jgi:RNA-directed DNA polymerase
MDGQQLFPTSEGTPQGGCISPLLANIAGRLFGRKSTVVHKPP